MQLFSRNIKLIRDVGGNFIGIALIRLLIGLVQFCTLLFLAVEFKLEEFGRYTIFSIFIIYGTFLVGFNFHTYVTRELANFERAFWSNLLNQNLYFLLISYFLSLPILFVMFHLNILPNEYSLIFFSILALSLVNNQLENFLLASGNPIQSTTSVLLRSVWVIPLIIFVVFINKKITIANVFQAWLIFELIGLVYCLVILKSFSLLNIYDQKLNIAFIARGLRVGLRYTIFGFMLLVTITAQRLILAHTHNEEHVGIFQFFFSIAVFLPNLVETALFSILMPRMIRENLNQNNEKIIFPNPRLFLIGIFGLSLGLIIIYFLLPIALSILNKDSLLHHKHLFIFIAIYSILYFTSRVFHYHLYAAKKDRLLGILSFLSMVVSISSSFFLIPRFGLIGAALSLVLTGVFMVIFFSGPFFKKSFQSIFSL